MQCVQAPFIEHSTLAQLWQCVVTGYEYVEMSARHHVDKTGLGKLPQLRVDMDYKKTAVFLSMFVKNKGGALQQSQLHNQHRVHWCRNHPNSFNLFLFDRVVSMLLLARVLRLDREHFLSIFVLRDDFVRCVHWKVLSSTNALKPLDTFCSIFSCHFKNTWKINKLSRAL